MRSARLMALAVALTSWEVSCPGRSGNGRRAEARVSRWARSRWSRFLARPLIDYVTLALEESTVERIYVATTENVPQTRIWATKRDLSVVNTPGMGFVADMIYAVKAASIMNPL